MSISKAVDVAEIVRNKFMPQASKKEVSLGTDEVPSRRTGTKGRVQYDKDQQDK
jgi:DNA-binding protein Alba